MWNDSQVPKKAVTQEPRIFPTEAAICERLRAARVECGLPLAYVAQKTECSLAALKTYEYARVPVRYGFAKRFCAALNINQGWLASGEAPMKLCVKIPSEIEKHIPENLLFSEVYTRILRDFVLTHLKSLGALADEFSIKGLSEFFETESCGFGSGWLSRRDRCLERLAAEIGNVAYRVPPYLLEEFSKGAGEFLDDFEEKHREALLEWEKMSPGYLKEEEDHFKRFVDYRLGRSLEPVSLFGTTAKKDLHKDTACRSYEVVYENNPETMHTEIDTTFAQRLLSARKKSGLTQSEAAKKWGISIGALRDWEQDRRKPTGLYKDRLEKILSDSEGTD